MRDVTREPARPSGWTGGMADRVRARDWSGTAVGPRRGGRRACRRRCRSVCRRGSRCTSGGARTSRSSTTTPTSRRWATSTPPLSGGPRRRSGPRRGTSSARWPSRCSPGRGATYSEDQQLFLRRHGYLEETYWTFSYSPIQDESGGVGGIFVAVTETTSGWSASGGSACWATSVSSRRCRPAPRRRRAGRWSTCSRGTGRRPVRGGLPARGRRKPAAGRVERSGAGGTVRRRSSAGRPTPSRCGGSPTSPRPRSSADLVGDTAAGRDVRRRARPSRPTPWSRPSSIAGRSEPAGVLVAGVNPYRALDGDYRVVLRPGGRPALDRGHGRADLRGRAAAGRGAGRAGPGQDRLLLQRQPRVPHPADADHGAGRGAARRARRRGGPAVARRARRRPPQRTAARQAGELPARLLPAAGGPGGGPLRAGRPGRVHRRAGERLPLGGGAGGPRVRGRRRAAARAGVRRPGHVGEGRPQPAVQRREVHLRGPDRRRPARPRGDRRC